MIERIAILGTGLLGASTGLALRASGFTGSITGWDRNPESAQTALVLKAIDSIAPDAVTAARGAQVTLLTTPVLAILDLMEKLASVLTPEQLVTDVGSTKLVIFTAALGRYNAQDKPAFLPGHPMAGKEHSGAQYADATLYQNAVWIFTDHPAAQSHRAEQAAALVTEWRKLVESMGARVLDLNPERHDELVAWVSHLPQFTATALSALLEDEVSNAPELKDVGGRALREMTRLGASPFSMWRDIAHTNTAAIERALLKLEQHLAHIRENLRTPELRSEFDHANQFRRE